MTHELKTHPDYFESVLLGKKKFEVRREDRDFRVGDVLRLREFSLTDLTDGYSGREIWADIIYILSSGQLVELFAVSMIPRERFCILGIDIIKDDEEY